MLNSFSHILICRTDNIGDLVLTLPLAGYLKSLYPGITVDFLVRAYAAPVVRHCRHVDQVIALESLVDPKTYFAQSQIDTIIFAYPSRRLAQAARQAGIKNRVGTSHRLHHWLNCNRLAHFSRVKSSLHEAQLNFALLRPLGIDITPPLKTIPAWYGLDAGRWDARFSERHFNLILHPKSNGNGREWPIGHYLALAQLLAADPTIVCWVTGSAQEGAWLAQHAAALLALPNVRNLCGSMDLDGLTNLIAAADGLVASGTGPLHLSAALGRPTLGLFPPLKPIDPARWAPLGEQAQVLCEAQPCRGCADAARCTCMQNITPAMVAEVIGGWQAAAGKSGAARDAIDTQP
jgi:ADP-heptose:LPS heptosyltransferase